MADDEEMDGSVDDDETDVGEAEAALSFQTRLVVWEVHHPVEHKHSDYFIECLNFVGVKGAQRFVPLQDDDGCGCDKELHSYLAPEESLIEYKWEAN